MFNRSIAIASASLGAVAAHSYAGISDALAGADESRSGRVYGDRNIRRVVRQYALKGIDHRERGRTSLAGRPHEHRMERARRLTKPGSVARRSAEMAARAGFMP